MIGSVAANSKPRLTRIYQAHSESFWPALTDYEAAGRNLKSVLMEQPDILQLGVQEAVQTILEVEMPFGKLAVSPLCLCGSSGVRPLILAILGALAVNHPPVSHGEWNTILPHLPQITVV